MRVSRACALLAIPFLLVALGALAARRAVPRWGTRIGRGASAVVTSLVPPRVSLRSVRPPLNESAPELLGTDAPADVGDAAAPQVAHLPADAVQWAIDDQGAHVHARPVYDERGKPAGMRLTGIAILGADIGLRDGDVLVAIDGEPALTEEAATDLALAAVLHGRSTLRAVAMRRGRPVAIVADLPPAPSAPAAGKAR